MGWRRLDLLAGLSPDRCPRAPGAVRAACPRRHDRVGGSRSGVGVRRRHRRGSGPGRCETRHWATWPSCAASPPRQKGCCRARGADRTRCPTRDWRRSWRSGARLHSVGRLYGSRDRRLGLARPGAAPPDEPVRVEAEALLGLGLGLSGRVAGRTWRRTRASAPATRTRGRTPPAERLQMPLGWLRLVAEDVEGAQRVARRDRTRATTPGSVRIAVWAYVWLARSEYLLGAGTGRRARRNAPWHCSRRAATSGSGRWPGGRRSGSRPHEGSGGRPRSTPGSERPTPATTS